MRLKTWMCSEPEWDQLLLTDKRAPSVCFPGHSYSWSCSFPWKSIYCLCISAAPLTLLRGLYLLLGNYGMKLYELGCKSMLGLLLLHSQLPWGHSCKYIPRWTDRESWCSYPTDTSHDITSVLVCALKTCVIVRCNYKESKLARKDDCISKPLEQE